MLYKIGDFSKIIHASIRTLRYYDEIDLFKPYKIDLFTGYRYYSDEQIDTYNLIKLLQEAGFSLEEIIEYWNSFDEQLMLKKKKQLFNNINETKNKIKKIDYLRSNIVNGKIILGSDKNSTKVLCINERKENKL